MNKYLPDKEIDKLCDEFEREIQCQPMPSIEVWLNKLDSVRKPKLLFWLLGLQLALEPKREEGYESWIEEYRRRFPDFRDVVDDFAKTLLPFDARTPKIPGYTLQQLIDRGGQGTVFRALQDRTGQLVAIKLVSTDELKKIPIHHRAQVVARLEKEIRIVASLKHVNVVKVYDAGECPDGFYFIMQLVEGGSISDRASALSQFESAKIIRAVAGALQEAHDSEIFHLDVKPHNILFDDVANQPLLADFGLACLSRDRNDKKVISGTRGFMAPEQAMGAEPDSRTDVFGLGATLYFLLTGRAPCENVKLPFSESDRDSWSPVPPRLLNRNVNSELEQICMQCLEFDPQARYQNCREIAEAIDRYSVAEDGRRIAMTGTRTLLTSPLFFLINLLVYVQIRLGWAEIPMLEPLVWLTMFSMYLVVFSVFKSVSNLDRHSPDHLAMESLWAVWLAKLFAALAVAGSLRLLGNGHSSQSLYGETGRIEEAVLMCYPMFSALTGFVLATLAPRYWRKLYVGAALCFLFSFVLMLTIVLKTAIAPLLYGTGATVLAIVWGVKLKRLAREQARAGQSGGLEKTVEFSPKHR